MIRGFVSATYAAIRARGGSTTAGHDAARLGLAPAPRRTRSRRGLERRRDGVRSLAPMSRLRARLAALWRGPISPATYRAITAAALVALGGDRRVRGRGAAHRLGHGLPHLADLRGRVARAPRRHRRPRLDRVREPHLHRARCRWRWPWPCSGPGACGRPGPTSPRWRGASWPAWSPRPCSAGSWCSLHVTPIAVAGHYLLSAVLVANAVRPPPPGRPARRAAGGRRHPGAAALVARAASALAGRRARHRHARHRQRAPRRRRGGRPAAVRGASRSCRVHSAAVWVLLARRRSSCCAGPSAGDAGARARSAAAACSSRAIVAQGALGYVQYFTGVPEGARRPRTCSARSLVWVAVLRFHLALTEPRARDAPAPRPAAASVAAAALMAGPAAARRGRRAGRRHRRTEPDAPVDRPRVERPDQPHVLRHLRAPEAVRLPEGEGRPR